jgi:hypothetical protein
MGWWGFDLTETIHAVYCVYRKLSQVRKGIEMGHRLTQRIHTCAICDKTPADGEYMWWMGSETWCEECCEREQAIANEEAQQNL